MRIVLTMFSGITLHNPKPLGMESPRPLKNMINKLLRLVMLSLTLIGPCLFAESEIMQFIGQDRSHVMKQWGPANSVAYAGEREILTYPKGRIFLTKGIVVEVGAPLPSVSGAGKLPRFSPAYSPSSQPRSAPSAAPAVPSRPTPAVIVAAPNQSAVFPPPAPKPSPQRPSYNFQPPPPVAPADALGSTIKTFFKIAGVLGLIGVLLLAAKIWTQRQIIRRRDIFSPTGAFPIAAKTDKTDSGSFSSPPNPPPLPIPRLTPALLDEMDWLLFEDLTADYFRLEGYQAELTRMGADGGVDIYLHRDNNPRPLAYVQCKAWGSRQIGVEPMRALYGVMAAAGIQEGYFVCIGEFSTDALSFARANNIQAITGDTFIDRFNHFPESERTRILTRITQGDYKTPSCAKCGTKMVTKDFSGRDHWCCPRYPKCRSKPIAVRKKAPQN